MSDDLASGTMWMGKVMGHWPISVFTTEEQAMAWMAQEDDAAPNRRLWKTQVQVLDEYDLVLSKPVLAPKGRG